MRDMAPLLEIDQDVIGPHGFLPMGGIFPGALYPAALSSSSSPRLALPAPRSARNRKRVSASYSANREINGARLELHDTLCFFNLVGSAKQISPPATPAYARPG